MSPNEPLRQYSVTFHFRYRDTIEHKMLLMVLPAGTVHLYSNGTLGINDSSDMDIRIQPSESDPMPLRCYSGHQMASIKGDGSSFYCMFCNNFKNQERTEALWKCHKCQQYCCTLCGQHSNRAKIHQWHVMTFAVDCVAGTFNAFVNGRHQGTAAIDDGFALVKDDKSDDPYPLLSVLGEPATPATSIGGELQFIRVDNHAFNLEEALAIHVGCGIWQCHDTVTAILWFFH